jgi:hypothetical protein
MRARGLTLGISKGNPWVTPVLPIQSLTFCNISTVTALNFKLCLFKFFFAFYDNKENSKINKNKNKQYVNNAPTCTVNTTPHFCLWSVPPLLHMCLHANGGVGGCRCKHQFAYPPPPSSCMLPTSVPPQHPHGCPPACHMCHAPPLCNQGMLGGTRKVCGMPPPFPHHCPHSCALVSMEPPSPLCSLPPAPVYTQQCMGTCCPPLFYPSCARGEGGAHGCMLQKWNQPQTPHPTLFSPFMGEWGGLGGLGLAMHGHVHPLSPCKWGAPQMTGTACVPVHPLLLEHPTPFPHLLAPPTLPWGGHKGVHMNRGRVSCHLFYITLVFLLLPFSPILCLHLPTPELATTFTTCAATHHLTLDTCP